jgi:hypothetical protein
MFVYGTLSFSQYAALLPTLTMKATLIASCWILFQAILAVYFPGPIGYPHIVLYLVTELLIETPDHFVTYEIFQYVNNIVVTAVYAI